jgi:hypothetical protein
MPVERVDGLRWDAKTGELAQVHVTSPHLEEDDAD